MTEPWADIVAIEQVLYRYAYVLDRGIQQRTLIVTDRHRFAGE